MIGTLSICIRRSKRRKRRGLERAARDPGFVLAIALAKDVVHREVR